MVDRVAGAIKKHIVTDEDGVKWVELLLSYEHPEAPPDVLLRVRYCFAADCADDTEKLCRSIVASLLRANPGTTSVPLGVE